MPTLRLPLPLTTASVFSRLLSLTNNDIKASVYFAVENGELIVSTEPLGDTGVEASVQGAVDAMRDSAAAPIPPDVLRPI